MSASAKRILAAVLAVLMLTSVSCAEKADSGSVDTVTIAADTVAEETTYDEYADLPTGSFEGADFNIALTLSNYAIVDMDSEELDGEVINDAIYNRNATIETKLGVVISQYVSKDYTEIYNTMTKLIASNDDQYDICYMESNNATQFAIDGGCMDILTVPEIDTSKAWWDQNSTERFIFNNKLYFIYGDLHLQRYEALYTIIFNKDLVTDYNLDDPYDYVNTGKWTLDNYLSMVTGMSEDLNGDGQFDAQNDMYGAIVVGNQPIYYTICCGEKFSQTEDDGTITYLGLNERIIDIFNKIAPVLSDTNVVMTSSTKGVSQYSNDIYSAFENNKSLFLVEVMGRVKELRAMDANFGLLPFPKYDEAQSDYMSGIAFSAGLMMIPITNSDLEMTGTVVENMCALSRRDLLPAYYEINLKGKQFRDDESEKMLDIMLNNIQYDLAYIFNWGNIVSTFNTAANANKDVASTFEKMTKSINKGIEKTVAGFGG